MRRGAASESERSGGEISLAAVVLAALVGLLAGGLGAGALQRTPVVEDRSFAAGGDDADASPLPPPHDGVLLAWTPDRLPATLEALSPATVPGVDAATVVRSAGADLVGSRTADGSGAGAPAPGWAYPVEVMAFDRRTFPHFVALPLRALFADLRPGEAVLGVTSARLRGVSAGGELEFTTAGRFRVAAVVDDEAIGGAEVAVAADEAGFAALPARYLLVRHAAERADVEAAIRALAGPGEAVRIRGAGETPFLRHGDAVLPPVLVKEQFGEFAYRTGEGRDIDQDVSWQRDHLVDVTLPLVGRVTCHRALVPALRGAFAALERGGLAGVIVSTAAGGGCWNSRRTEEGGELSRHAWGAAIDLNVGKNPTGLASVQDPQLVEILEQCGFTWGGNWLEPDPAHFEYRRPPAPAAC